VTPFEYILPLIAVLVGIAISDVAVSLHRLLRARHRVKWDWLPLAGTVLALLAFMEVWWTFYASREGEFFTSLGGFLPLVGQLLILFLLTAAALPDEVPDEGIDLRSFYDQNGSYYWTLFASYVVFIVLMRITGSLASQGSGFLQTVTGLVPNFVLLAGMVALARVRHRMFHGVAVVALLCLFLAQWWGLRLVN
jgi:hypothetical protein